MENVNQIHIPQSFLALFVNIGRQKPNATRDIVVARYEICEDLANMLAGSASNMVFSLGISEREVLQRCRLGLVGEGSVIAEAEADWAIHRLAELLEW